MTTKIIAAVEYSMDDGRIAVFERVSDYKNHQKKPQKVLPVFFNEGIQLRPSFVVADTASGSSHQIYVTTHQGLSQMNLEECVDNVTEWQKGRVNATIAQRDENLTGHIVVHGGMVYWGAYSEERGGVRPPRKKNTVFVSSFSGTPQSIPLEKKSPSDEPLYETNGPIGHDGSHLIVPLEDTLYFIASPQTHTAVSLPHDPLPEGEKFYVTAIASSPLFTVVATNRQSYYLIRDRTVIYCSPSRWSLDPQTTELTLPSAAHSVAIAGKYILCGLNQGELRVLEVQNIKEGNVTLKRSLRRSIPSEDGIDLEKEIAGNEANDKHVDYRIHALKVVPIFGTEYVFFTYRNKIYELSVDDLCNPKKKMRNAPTFREYEAEHRIRSIDIVVR